ncbi:hypothetical protein [Rubritalea profundi]|uniref:hypothetical protein n=1 Tax=Rubritalea profundi TaxID=1658618 RepID=UPI00101AEA2C|nr:hypothetical protein [Rubritalea profundi]
MDLKTFDTGKYRRPESRVGLDTHYVHNVTLFPRNATVPVAQNNSSEAADSRRSDLTSELQLTQQTENQAFGDQLKATETVSLRNAPVSVAQIF